MRKCVISFPSYIAKEHDKILHKSRFKNKVSMPLATTTQLICTLSLVHVSAKHIFSWMPQLLYDFRKHKTPSVPVIQSITLRRRLIQLDAARGGRWSQVSSRLF